MTRLDQQTDHRRGAQQRDGGDRGPVPRHGLGFGVLAVGEKSGVAQSLPVTADDLRDIQAAVSRIEVHGARYSEAAQKMVGR